MILLKAAGPRLAYIPVMNPLVDFTARWMPPPHVVGLLLRWCPQRLQQATLAQVLNHLVVDPHHRGEFGFLEGRSLAVEVKDMRLRWVLTAADGRLTAGDPDRPADTTIAGAAVDFLLLAAGLEDPDTLFFQRRLEVRGDTAIGLTTRNLLDRLPVNELPLGFRIVVNRTARFGRRIRKHRSHPATLLD